jgi:ring-1,2-phenylacetyl-CoA epoxidase subunit PaaE
MIKINGRKYVRPYSFSSAPEIDQTLDITIKRVQGGIVSNYIIDEVNIGDVLEVIEPMGNFTLNNYPVLPDDHIFLWGVGSGITPLMSLAKFAIQKKSVKQVTLVYGNRSSETAIFKEKIEDLKRKYDNFSVWNFHTRSIIAPDDSNIIQGRIRPDKVLSVLKKYGDFNKTVHYICGPAGLKTSVKEALSNLGIDNERIFSEDFEIIRNPLDFKDIETRKVSINKENISYTVEVVKGQSILDGGLDAMIDLSYSCQTGSCMLCKGRILNGKVKMLGLDKFPDGLKEDECLLCCSYPLTEDLEISID